MTAFPRLPMLTTLSCGGAEGPKAGLAPPGSPTAAQDIPNTHLSLDLAPLTGAAALHVVPARVERFVRLDVSGLDLADVRVEGRAVSLTRQGDRVLIPVGEAPAPVRLDIAYRFTQGTLFEFAG